LRGHDYQVNCVAYSPDGRWLASTDGRCIRVWDAFSGTYLRTLTPKGAAGAGKLVYSPDSRRLACANLGGILTVYDIGPQGEVIGERTIAAFPSDTWDVAFSPDGGRLAAAGRGKAVKVFDLQTRRQVLTVPLDRPSCESVTFSPDGRLIAGACGSTFRV